MHTYINKWRPIEIAVLLALAVTLLVGAASLHRQDGLQEKMIRLHVIANSDSEDDQAMKLLARDAVLTRAEAILRQASNREEAMEDLNAALPELERLAIGGTAVGTGLNAPKGGCVTLDGQNLSALRPRARARRMAYVPQSSGLAFPYEVREVVLMGRVAHMAPGAAHNAADRRAERDGE